MRSGRHLATTLLVGVLLGGMTVTLGQAAPVRAQPGSESGPVTLVSGADLSFGGIRRQLVDYWNRQPANRDRQIRIVELASVADLQRAQLLAAEQAGDAGYDVLNLDLTWTAEFAENAAIRPLDDGVLTAAGPNDFFDRPLDSARYRKQLWAVPFNTDVGLLYYRKDLLDAADRRPPKSWQDMVDAQRAVHDQQVHSSGASTLRAAYTAQLGRYEGLTVNAVEAAAAAGENLVRLPAESKGLLELAARVRDGTILPESTTFDESGSLQAFRDGAVLFMRNWPFAYNVLAADPALPAGKVGKVGKVGIARLPWPGALGGQNLAIAAHSTKPRLAREVIEFLTSPSSEQCLLERGGLAATRRAVYDQAAHLRCFLDPAPGDGTSGGGADTLYAVPEAVPALVDSLNGAVLRPATPYYSQVTDVIQDRVTKLLTTEDYRKVVEGLPGALSEALAGR